MQINKKLLWQLFLAFCLGYAFALYVFYTSALPSNSTDTEEKTVNTLNTSEFRQKIVALTNEKRGENKILPLETDYKLCEFANVRLADMYNVGFSHDTFREKARTLLAPSGTYAKWGENLRQTPHADQYFTERRAVNDVDAWYSSKSHRENMLDSEFTHTCVRCDDKFCVQIFAQRNETLR